MEAEVGAMWGKGHEPWGVAHLKARTGKSLQEELHPVDTGGKEAKSCKCWPCATLGQLRDMSQ